MRMTNPLGLSCCLYSCALAQECKRKTVFAFMLVSWRFGESMSGLSGYTKQEAVVCI